MCELENLRGTFCRKVFRQYLKESCVQITLLDLSGLNMQAVSKYFIHKNANHVLSWGLQMALSHCSCTSVKP